MNDAKFQRQVIGVNALIPALLMAWDWNQGRLGANPVEFVTRATGVLSLVFLALTLIRQQELRAFPPERLADRIGQTPSVRYTQNERSFSFHQLRHEPSFYLAARLERCLKLETKVWTSLLHSHM